MKNRALTHPLCSLRTAWIQTFRPSVRQKGFCRIGTLLVWKKICWCWFSVAIYISIYHDSVHPHRGQRPPMLFALCLLLSSSQLTSLSPISFFQFQEILLRQCPLLTAFSNWTTLFFQFTRDNFPAKFFHDNLLVTHDPRILATSFPVKLEFKNKNKRNNGTITFSWWKQLPCCYAICWPLLPW